MLRTHATRGRRKGNRKHNNENNKHMQTATWCPQRARQAVPDAANTPQNQRRNMIDESVFKDFYIGIRKTDTATHTIKLLIGVKTTHDTPAKHTKPATVQQAVGAGSIIV
jgi:hypothetical protein